MDVIIIGAGPAGLTVGAALARRRHRVVALDADPGPAADGSWRRRGVMQFEQGHGFRPQVPDLLRTEWPEAWDAWGRLGAETVERPGPGGPVDLGVRSRRATYERALRRAAADVDGLTVGVGRVERLAEEGERVVGVVVGGELRRAELVIDASGRLSRFASPPELIGDVGMAYVCRTYRRRPGAAPGPLQGPISWSGRFRGYDSYVFPHERGHFLGGHHQADRRRRPWGVAPRRRLRRGLPGHPRAGHLDRPSGRDAHQRGHGRRWAGERLPAPARPARPRGHR